MKIFVSFIIILVVSLSFAQDFPVTVTDAAGQSITFDAPVERIICLSSSCQDHLFLLGLEPIGISNFMRPIHQLLRGELPGEDITLLNVEVTDYQPDLEQVLALEPDVVIGLHGLQDDVRQPLADAGIPMLLSYADSLEDSVAELRNVAAITGTSSQVEALVTKMEDRLSAYRKLSPNDASVALIFGSSPSADLMIESKEAQTCGTLMLYELATCPATLEGNASPFAQFGYAQYSVEGLLALNPDAIFFAGYNMDGNDDPAVLAAVSQNPLWSEITAVKNDNLHTINAWTFGGQSGLTLLARAIDQSMQLLYPDIFPEALSDAQVQEVLQE